ncbi:Hypothetical_protein [Hexamita inflata]|uniref:Hypothetical_protein n=1 Tax=Hexamita inflata TaxID=28002 RepID=A0AA86TY15_9EUKA|nr:Hypothetical protein HINF_LOCUS12618 [Hexamita inflata]
MVVKPDWRKEQEDPMIGIRTQLQFITSSASTGPAEDLGVHLQLVNLNDFRYFLITKNNGGLFLSISTGAQDEVLVLRLIRIIIQVVTVAFILNIQIMNAFLFLKNGSSGLVGPSIKQYIDATLKQQLFYL